MEWELGSKGQAWEWVVLLLQGFRSPVPALHRAIGMAAMHAASLLCRKPSLAMQGAASPQLKNGDKKRFIQV